MISGTGCTLPPYIREGERTRVGTSQKMGNRITQGMARDDQREEKFESLPGTSSPIWNSLDLTDLTKTRIVFRQRKSELRTRGREHQRLRLLV